MKIITDKNEALSAVRQDGRALKFASDELRNDREVVLRAVVKNKYKWALQYASEELQNDREVVLEAVKQGGYALNYASVEMRYDREVAFQFVLSEYFHHCAHYIPVLFWNEREFVLEAVKQDGRALGYASEELRTDREVVLEAMKNGGSLYEASKELSNDPELRKLAGWDE